MPFRTAAYGYYQLRSGMHDKKYIFIFSPMRSGSTMLVHILSSNPDVVGIGETHIRYDNKKRFDQLICHNYWGLRKFRMKESYVVDKIVHSRLLPDPELLMEVDAHYIFLTRNAEQSIYSLIRHFSHYDAKKALTYWNNKMDELEALSETLKPSKRSIFLTYESVTRNPDQVLEKLTDTLDLDVALTKKYHTNKYTGKRVIGDSTKNILTGEILPIDGSAQSTIINDEIDDLSIRKAADRLKICRAKLSETCETVIG